MNTPFKGCIERIKIKQRQSKLRNNFGSCTDRWSGNQEGQKAAVIAIGGEKPIPALVGSLADATNVTYGLSGVS